MMNLQEMIPADWQDILAAEFEKEYFADLQEFVANQYEAETVYPPQENIFSAFQETSFQDTHVLLLGQDPYHGEGQAHGLCFSVHKDIKLPPSLRNIYKEMASDLEVTPPKHGYLLNWAQQGVLMLNTVLTVRANNANSHQKKGWENFTDAVIQAVSAKEEPVCFVLWGNPAQTKLKLIDQDRHHIISSAHPSPLSARRGFFGSKPFSAINEFLRKNQYPEIDWLPEADEDSSQKQQMEFSF